MKSSKKINIIRYPILSEKSTHLGQSKYAFVVDKRADKPEIKKAFEEAFDVKVDAVRTVNYLGKPKQMMGRAGSRASYKKAYITLKAGFTLPVVEGV